MLDVLVDFVEALRRGGVPVSPHESLDAAVAVREIALEDKAALKSALSATLVKSKEHHDVFGMTFDVYFSSRVARGEDAPSTERLDHELTEVNATSSGERFGTGDSLGAARITEMLQDALLSGDEALLRRVAAIAVERFAGIERSRPVGVSYYLFRTVRALDLDGVMAAMLHADDEPHGAGGDLTAYARSLESLEGQLFASELRRHATELQSLIEKAITAALVADRGVDAVMSSLRRTALGDVDFMHATKEELTQIRHALIPLARLLAVRLARRRRHRRKGPLDFRATIRSALSTGGVPIEPRFSAPHPAKPELVVIADISGSVASFARFTLQLVYAISSQFSKVQSFVFVDGLDDVTAIFRRASSPTEAVERVARDADVMHHDGHSDYGRALSIFSERYLSSVTPRSDVLILGDARNNYHSARAELLGEIKGRCRHMYWLNPEPRAYWGSGDSIIGEYARHCDGVFECRNLHQLEAFVSALS